MKITYLGALTLSLFLASCAQEDLGNQGNPQDQKSAIVQLTPEEALSISYQQVRELSDIEIINIVKNFNEGNELSRSGDIGHIKIRDKYYITDNVVSRTVSRGLPIAVVEVEDNNGKNLAYVCTDNRSGDILAYLPERKELDDITSSQAYYMLSLAKEAVANKIKKVEHLKDSLYESTILKLKENINIPDGNIDFSSIKDKIKVIGDDDNIVRSAPVENPPYVMTQKGPFCEVAWNQREPYNRKLPTLPQFSDLHFPAGCGVVAVATLLSIVEPNMTVSSIPVNWAYLKERPTIIEPSYGGWAGEPDPQDKRDMIAYLIKDIYYGTNATTSFEKDPYMGETSTRSDHLQKYLQGKINIDNWDRINLDNQLNSMNNSRPILMSGKDSSNGNAHAWVIDGYRLCKKSKARELIKIYDIYFHANMGWGESKDNGYYLIHSDLSLTFETSASHYNSNLQQMCNARKK